MKRLTLILTLLFLSVSFRSFGQNDPAAAERNRIKEELKRELKKELVEVMRQEAEAERQKKAELERIKAEVRAELMKEMKEAARNDHELRAQLKEELLREMRDDKRSQEQLRNEIKEEIAQEYKAETRTAEQIRRELKEELRKEVSEKNQKELDREVRKEERSERRKQELALDEERREERADREEREERKERRRNRDRDDDNDSDSDDRKRNRSNRESLRNDRNNEDKSMTRRERRQEDKAQKERQQQQLRDLRMKLERGRQSGVNFGLLAGVNLSNFNQKNQANISEDQIAGFVGGGFFRFHSKWFYFQPEVLYSGKGADFGIKLNQSETVTNNRLRLNSLDIPLMVGVKLLEGRKMNLRLHAGPLVGILLNTRGGSSGAADSNFKTLTAGYQAGLGFDLGNLTIDLRYEGSFSDLTSPEGRKALSVNNLRNQIFRASVGFKIF